MLWTVRCHYFERLFLPFLVRSSSFWKVGPLLAVRAVRLWHEKSRC
jgi:hypothetical protein